MDRKPLGQKSYGHIPHLPGSRIGPGDHKCEEKQMKIACEKIRNKHDRVIVQEKLDGSNVGIARVNDNRDYILDIPAHLRYNIDINKECVYVYNKYRYCQFQ